MLVAICTVMSGFAEKLYLKKGSDVDYMKDGALVAVWSWVGGGQGSWGVFTQLEGDIAVADIQNGATGIKIVRFASDVQTPDWSANAKQWNATGDINKPSDKNMITLNQWSGATGGDWDNYVTAVPSISFSVGTFSFLNEAVTFAATSENVTNPVYVYSVKQGEGAYTALEGNTWTPAAEGVYTIKAEVKEGADGGVVASEEVTTTVVFKPEEITIKVQIPAEGLSEWIAASGVYFYVWGDGLEGAFNQATAEEDNWYSYTVSTEAAFPINFIVVNGGSWDAIKPEGSQDSDPRRQTEDMMNVLASTCYVMANGGETDGQNNWKKTLTATECPSEGGDPTAIEETENAPLFSINGRTLNVAMEEEAEISIYTISGQMIEHTIASDYAREMQQGVYVIRIGNTTQKAVVY